MSFRRIVAAFDHRNEAESARAELVDLGLDRDQISIVDNSARDGMTDSGSGETGSGEKVGFWAHIKEMFMPDEDRATIDETIRRGGYVLSALVSEEKVDDASRLLEEAGAVDLDKRETEWRTAGRDARLTSREVSRGSVRVRSYVVEEPVHEQIRLREERVEVERRPAEAAARQRGEGSAEDLLQDRTIEVSETGEAVVVRKEAVVTEEVRVRKTIDERVEDIDDTVRRTEADAEDGRAGAGAPRTEADPRRPTQTNH